MKPHNVIVERLIREAEEARLEEAVLEATVEDLLDRAREVCQAVELKVRQVAGRQERFEHV